MNEFDHFFREINEVKGLRLYEGPQAQVFQYGEDDCLKVYTQFTIDLDDIKRIDQVINGLIGENKLTHTLKYDRIFDKSKLYAVQMKRGNDLRTFLNFNRRSLLEKCSLMYQMVVAVDELHKNKITHLDIKPENMVLIVKDGYQDLKLIDFGISKNQVENIVHKGGTGMYISPDSVTQDLVTYKVDNWALGVIFYLLVIGFYEVDMPQPDFSKLNQEFIYSTIQSQVSQSTIGEKLARMISQLLNRVPCERLELSAAQVVIFEVLHLIPEISIFNSIFKFEYQTVNPHWLFDNHENFYEFQLTHKLSATDKGLQISSQSLNWSSSLLSESQEEAPAADILKFEFDSHKILNTDLTIWLKLNQWVFINKGSIENLQQDQFINWVYCLTRYSEQCRVADRKDFLEFCEIALGFKFKEHPSDVPLKPFISQMILVYFKKNNLDIEKCVYQVLQDNLTHLPENLQYFQNNNKFIQINSQIMRDFNQSYYFTINCRINDNLNIKGVVKSDKTNYTGNYGYIICRKILCYQSLIFLNRENYKQ